MEGRLSTNIGESEMSEMKYNNVGKFSIDANEIEFRLEEAKDLFSSLRILVLRAEMMYHNNTIEYMGICHKFRSIAENEVVPSYNLTVIRNIEGTTFEVQEVK